MSDEDRQLQAAIAASLRDYGEATGSGSTKTTGTVMCPDDGGREGSSSKPIVLDGSDHDEDTTGFTDDDTHTAADIKPKAAARKKAASSSDFAADDVRRDAKRMREARLLRLDPNYSSK